MKICLFYAPEDRPIAHVLLALLESEIRASNIIIVSPEHLNTGMSLHEETEKLLSDCAVFVLFVSAQVFAHPAYQMIEPILIDRFKSNRICYFPIKVRHCLWEASEISKLDEPVHPNNSIWFSEYSNQDQQDFLKSFSGILSSLYDSYKEHVRDGKMSIERTMEQFGTEYQGIEQVKKQFETFEKMVESGTYSRSSLFIYMYALIKDLNHFFVKIRKTQGGNPDIDLQDILYLYANPIGKAAALFERELKQIDNVLESYRETKIVKRSQVEAFELLKELTLHPSKIVHIAVHGSRDGYLMFVDDADNMDGITADRLYRVFEQLKSKGLLPELLLINACHSKGHAEKLAELVPYTIGMNGSIPVTAAVKFAEIFYLNYLAGASILFSFEEGVLALKKLNLDDVRDQKVHEMPHFFNHKK